MNWESVASLRELLERFDKVEKIVEQYGHCVIISEDKPKYLLSKFDSSFEGEDSVAADSGQIIHLLNGIGQRVFVTYFYQFQNDEDPFVFLRGEGFSDHSVRSRASKARTIFRNGWQKDALNRIAHSSRTDHQTRKLARALLEACR